MWRTAGRTVLIVVLVLAAPIGAAAIGIRGAFDDVYTSPPASALGPDELPSAPAHDADKPTVAIVMGHDGANVVDTMAPFEVFSRTKAFNVYTVSERREPLPLTGGLDIVPDLTFDELHARVDGAPDVIVIAEQAGSNSDVVAWLEDQHVHGDPLLMSVCVGVVTLAETGLLDGRPATTHWLKLIGVRRFVKDVNWKDGVRFVDDGDIISTAGVLSGADGALRVVERMLGRAEAERVAKEMHWDGYPVNPVRIPRARPGFADLVGLLSAGYRWDRPTNGVLLTDGVGELELASAFRPPTYLSFLAQLRSISADGGPIRSRHGLTFVPRSDWAGAVDDVDRVVVPGHRAAQERVADGLAGSQGVDVHYLHDRVEFPLDGALRDIADTYDVATARWIAKSIQYPAGHLDLEGSTWPWALTLRPLLLAALSGAMIAIFLGVRRRRREAARPEVQAEPWDENVPIRT